MLPAATCRWTWLALIALQAAWHAWWHPPEVVSIPAAVGLAVGPLLLPAWWIWKLRHGALLIGGMILLVYFSLGVAEAWTDPAVRVPALVQVGLVVLYFLALPGVGRRRSGPR